MSLLYNVGFSAVGANQSMTATIAGNAATVAASTYAHVDLSSLMGTGNYGALSGAVQTAFNNAGGGPWTVSRNFVTGLYTISRATNFTLAFSSASDLRLRAALGFTANLSGANSYTSTVLPYYTIITEIGARSDISYPYEPDDIAEEAVSDGGVAFGTSRVTSELWNDWAQMMEPLDATFERSAVAAAPWTWQHLFRHARAQYPIQIYDTVAAISEICTLRAEGASFHPERYATDYDGQWSIPFRTRYLGML
jgi:hypothetical protein